MTNAFTIKICGINDAVSLDTALRAGADMVGFVFFPPSPRHISLESARRLAARVEGRAKKVALTVNADDEALEAIIAELAPDLLQLHGDETPARAAEVRVRFELPIVRALPIAERIDLDAIVAFDAVVDHFLFDARPPPGANRPGGHGAAFDWSLLQGVATSRPWLLAGGLTDVTVAAAIAATNASGVDVSSGVESSPGHKDPDKIARFVANARVAATGRLGSGEATA